MNHKSFILKSAILLLSVFVFISCSDDDDNGGLFSGNKGAFIINAGKPGNNNATLSFYDKETEECASLVFEAMNGGANLGDLAQDILLVDNKLYIAVYGSRVIYVTDAQGKVLKEIKSEKDGQLQGPRALTADNNYVYVTYYDGYLARINKNTLALDTAQVEVGAAPEELKIANNKIYVAVSGGYPNYDNKVAVVDAKKFEKTGDIEVVLNPTGVEVDKDNNIYILSMGDYGVTAPNTLQRIDTKADTVYANLGNATFMKMHPRGDKLYTIYSQWGNPDIKYNIYDVKTNEYETNPFVKSGVTFSASPVCISVDPQTNEIYVGVTDYKTVSDVYIIDPATGGVVKQFASEGMSIKGLCFVK